MFGLAFSVVIGCFACMWGGGLACAHLRIPIDRCVERNGMGWDE